MVTTVKDVSRMRQWVQITDFETMLGKFVVHVKGLKAGEDWKGRILWWVIDAEEITLTSL